MPCSDKTQKDFYLVFSTSLEDIRFAKRQQWQIVYYALILMAGIFYLMTYYDLSWFEYVLKFLIGVIAVSGTYFIIMIDNDMLKYRKTLEEAQKTFSKEVKEAYPIPENYRHTWIFLKNKKVLRWKVELVIPRYNFKYSLVQIIAILIAATLLISISPKLRDKKRTTTANEPKENSAISVSLQS